MNDAPVASYQLVWTEQEVDEDVDPGATYQVLAFTDEEDDTTSLQILQYRGAVAF